jgi:hypothetical protein
MGKLQLPGTPQLLRQLGENGNLGLGHASRIPHFVEQVFVILSNGQICSDTTEG